MHACIQLSFDAYENNNYYIDFSQGYSIIIILYYTEGAKGSFSILKKSPHQHDVLDLLRDHTADWIDLGIELEVSENKRTEFSQDDRLSPYGKLDKVLSYWIRAEPTPVTWEKVKEVLIKLNFRSTAKKVERFLQEVDTVEKYKNEDDWKPFNE